MSSACLLDNQKLYQNQNLELVLKSIAYFPQQCLQVLKEISTLSLPNLDKKINHIVVCGMGGSAFAPEIVKYLFYDELPSSYEIIRDYSLPYYVDKNSLVIISSYSGTTEEALSCLKQALKKTKHILFLCAQRESSLMSLASRLKLKGYCFKEKFNPSLQPRMGVGYMMTGHLALLVKSGLLKVSFSQIKKAISELPPSSFFSLPFSKNSSKQYALKLQNKFIFLVASEFLRGAIHGFANQLNETAKTNACYHFIPELNHHLMEGLKFPSFFKKKAVFLFFPSCLYQKNNQIRYKITAQVVKKNGYQVLEYQPSGKDKFSQVFEVVQFNSYVSFYLSVLNKVDPNHIPWVDYFKEQLKKYQNEQ